MKKVLLSILVFSSSWYSWAQNLSITGVLQSQTYNINGITNPPGPVQVGRGSDRKYIMELTFTISSASGINPITLSDFKFAYQGTNPNDISNLRMYTKQSPNQYLTPGGTAASVGGQTPVLPALGTNVLIDFNAVSGTFGATGIYNSGSYDFSFPIPITIAGTYRFQIYASISGTAGLGNIIDLSFTGFNVNSSPYTGSIGTVDMSNSLSVAPNLSGVYTINPTGSPVFGGYNGSTFVGSVFTSSGQAFDAINRYGIADGGLSLLYKDDVSHNEPNADYTQTTAERFPNQILWQSGRSNAPFLIGRTGDGNMPKLNRSQFALFVLDGPQYTTIQGIYMLNTAPNSLLRNFAWILVRGDRLPEHVTIRNNIMDINSPATANNNSYILFDNRRSANDIADMNRVVASHITIENNLFLNGVSAFRTLDNLNANVPIPSTQHVIIRNNTATGFSRGFIRNAGFTGMIHNVTVSGNFVGLTNKLVAEGYNDGISIVGGINLFNVSGDVAIYNNVIRSITFSGFNTNTNNSTPTRGIGLSLSTQRPSVAYVFNNEVSDLCAPNATITGVVPMAVRGIDVGRVHSTSVTVNQGTIYVYHNSVLLNKNTSQDNSGQCAFQYNGNDIHTVYAANNSFVVKSTYTGVSSTIPGLFTAVFNNQGGNNNPLYSSLSGTNMVYVSTGNFNFLYSINAPTSITGSRAVDISQYRARFTATGANFNRERFTFSEANTPFLSNADLRLTPTDTTTSKVFGGSATLISGLPGSTFDLVGNLRPLSQATIGAYEFVDKLNQTITGLPTAVSMTATGVTASLSGLSNSGLPITYSSSNTVVVTIGGNILVPVGKGFASVTASQPGNFVFNAAPNVTVMVTVSGLAQEITFPGIPNKPANSSPFALTAISNSGSPVSYSILSGPASISGNTLTLVSPSKGDVVTVRASQGGNSVYEAASDVDASFTVLGISQEITGFNSLGTVPFGYSPINLATVTGGGSGNPVTFNSSNTVVATIDGSNIVIVGVGTTTITASQLGNATYENAEPVYQVLTVIKANQSITGFNSLGTVFVDNGPIDLSGVSGGASGNAVTFTSSNLAVATISGTSVVVISAGTTTITASQFGNDLYEDATPVNQILTVSKLNQTVSGISANATVTYGDAPFTMPSQTLQGLPINYTVSNLGIVSVSGNSFTIINAGVTTITGTNVGDMRYEALTVMQVLTVEPRPLSIQVENVTITYGEPFPAFTGSVLGLIGGDDVVVTYQTSAPASPDAGTYAISAVLSGAKVSNYQPSITAGVFTINKATQTITGLSSFQVTLPGSGALALPLNPTATSNLPVSLSVIEGSGEIVSDTLLLVSIPGLVKIRLSQAGNQNYEAASEVEFIVTVVAGSVTSISKSDDLLPTFKVFPNPSSGSAYVLSGAHTSVYSIEGTLITTINPSVEAQKIEGLKPGVYILKSGTQVVRLVVH